MRDSDTFLAILDEGREEGLEEEARNTILRQGKRRFGPVSEATTVQLEAIGDLERLRRLLDRIHEATDWQDLIGTP